VNSLPKNVTRQRRDCDLNPGPSAPESSTLTTRLPSHPSVLDRGPFSRGEGATWGRVMLPFVAVPCPPVLLLL